MESIKTGRLLRLFCDVKISILLNHRKSRETAPSIVFHEKSEEYFKNIKLESNKNKREQDMVLDKRRVILSDIHKTEEY